MDSMTVTVALLALCVANLAMVLQVLRLTDMVDHVQDEVHAVAMWLIHREERRAMRELGYEPVEEAEHDER